MLVPIFIDLTQVKNNSQCYITLNLLYIKEIVSEENTIILDGGFSYEITEESMQKLLDTIEDNSLILGANYKLPEVK